MAYRAESAASPASPNAETIEAWDGPLYDRFERFRPVVTDSLGVHGDAALELFGPGRGERVLDIGCGFGDATSVSRRSSAPTVKRSGSTSHRASSRPPAWTRRRGGVQRALLGRRCAERLPSVDPTTSPSLGSGRFCGYTEVCLRRHDVPMLIGDDIDEAIELVTALGPAGEILRLAGDRAAHLQGQVRAALRAGMAEFDDGEGIRAPSSTWIVTARAPSRARRSASPVSA